MSKTALPAYCMLALHTTSGLPMSEDTLRGWYWTGVVVLALVLWIIWYMVVKA